MAVGADLEPPTLIAAYSQGLFPMPLRPGGRIGWWSPPERGVLQPEGLMVRRSLRQACRRYEIRVDTAFAEVVEGCADPARPHGWIDDQMRAAYVQLHHAGFAHSVETWSGGELVGGLYGVAIGGLFAGESMFHRARDASKVALVAGVAPAGRGCGRGRGSQMRPDLGLECLDRGDDRGPLGVGRLRGDGHDLQTAQWRCGVSGGHSGTFPCLR